MPERCLTPSGLHEFEARYHERCDPEIVAKLVDEYTDPIGDFGDEIRELALIRQYVGDVCPHCGATVRPDVPARQAPSEATRVEE